MNPETTVTPEEVEEVDAQAAQVEMEVETAEQPEILEELIIEEVSIDGMCGVY